MDSQNIFDVFGRQINIQNFDNSALKNEFKNDIKEMNRNFIRGFDQFKDHVQKTEALVNAIGLSKNYITLNHKKRIVGVKLSIDKNDVVSKSELEELSNSLIKIGNDLTEALIRIEKDLTEALIKTEKEFKKHIEDYEKFKQHVKDSINEIYEKLNQLGVM